MTLRVLDPAGVADEWLAAQLPDAEFHRIPDGEFPYDAGLLCADLDNKVNPGERIAAMAQDIKRPGGRIYVSVPHGTASGRMSVRTPGRRRSWHSVDVADLLRRFGVMQDFGVDEEGYISATLEPKTKGAEIAVWTGYAIGDWNPMDIVTRGLGGSETAAYRISETLADMGYVVTLYGQFNQEGAIKDVILKDYRKFDPTTPRKAVITFRNAEMFDRPVNAETKILWLEDVAGAEGLDEKRAEQIDYICGVSEWHKRNVEDVYPWLPSEKVIASRNGITHSYFEGEAPEREQRLLYTSSPDRGLHIVLECWPEIKARVPEALFFHCYGPWYDIVANVSPDAAAYRARCRRMTEDFEGVKAVGPLGQKDLAMLMRSSRVWSHPSHFIEYCAFDETNCLSGDTLIDMPRSYRTHPDGVPIQELEGKSGFPVWAWDEDAHRFTLATAKRVWKARENAETVRIEFDEGTTLTCTPDHPVLTVDGDWIDAGLLRSGDRLRGLNYRFTVAVNAGDGRWTNEHRVVGEWLEGRELDTNEHVHHDDPTRLDNRPEGLDVLTASEHHSLTHRGRKHDRHYCEHSRETQLAWKATPEGQAHFQANARKAGQKLWEWVRSLPEDERTAWLSSRAQKAAATVRQRQNGATAVANHCVRSVSPGPTVDVYDMEVEGLHNFVAGGVVVHNCIGVQEAQAAGLYCVTNDRGALGENNIAGVQIHGDPLTPEWREQFIEEVVRGLTDPETQRKAEADGPIAVADRGWTGVCSQLQGLWERQRPEQIEPVLLAAA